MYASEERHRAALDTTLTRCRCLYPVYALQPVPAAAAAAPRRALSDIINLLSPIQSASPRRTHSAEAASSDQRPLHSRMDPLQRYASVVLTQIGFKPAEAAPLIGTSARCVKRWRDRYEDDGEVEESYRCGRPKLLDENKMDALISEAIDAPKASTPRQLKHLFDLSCSSKTVRRVLDDAGLYGRIARVMRCRFRSSICSRL